MQPIPLEKCTQNIKRIRVTCKDMRLLRVLGMQQTASERIKSGQPVVIGKGVRQGCLMSPFLLIIFEDVIQSTSS